MKKLKQEATRGKEQKSTITKVLTCFRTSTKTKQKMKSTAKSRLS
jgi:hypothetical protein